MPFYAYVTANHDQTEVASSLIKEYARARNISLAEHIEDAEPNHHVWQNRNLYHLIQTTMQSGDTLVIYDASHLARSTSQVLEILVVIAQQNISLILVKDDEAFQPDPAMGTQAFLKMILQIESDFVTRRVSDALARRKAAGLSIGRPKGRLNRSLKLDKYREDIQKYLDLNVSRASIAKLIGCNPQTLYNYIEKRNLKRNPEAEVVAATSVAS